MKFHKFFNRTLALLRSRMIKQLLSGMLISLLVASCQDTSQERFAAIDSMQGVLANVSHRSEEVNQQLLERYIKQVDEKLVLLDIEDSLSTHDLLMVDEFRSLSGRFQNCLATTLEVRSSLNETRQQLLNLRKDVESGVWHTDSLNQFLETEFLYITDLDEAMDGVIAQLNASFDTYEALEPKVEQLLMDTISK